MLPWYRRAVIWLYTDGLGVTVFLVILAGICAALLGYIG